MKLQFGVRGHEPAEETSLSLAKAGLLKRKHAFSFHALIENNKKKKKKAALQSIVT